MVGVPVEFRSGDAKGSLYWGTTELVIPPEPKRRSVAIMTKKYLNTSASVVAIVVAVVVGSLLGRGGPDILGMPVAKGMTAMGGETFAACTASIDNATDGFFLLDFETGDLTGGVLNPNTAKFTVAYRHNVLKDLGFKPGGAPKFVMVAGRMSFGGTAGNRMGQAVIYVTDASTGVSAAYGIPWSSQQSTGGRAGVSALTLLDVARPRGGVAP
jgi:hypothetical protein